MQTLESIKAIIANITYLDWTFRVDVNKDGTPFLQILFTDVDRISGLTEVQRCRKWQLSKHMVNSEIVRTAFKAVEAAILHEAQEGFLYKGVRVYNPHLDLDALVEFAKSRSNISIRDEVGYKPTVPAPGFDQMDVTQ